jgi:RNA polymerase sigma-70 factor (ECF subfamily)
MTDVGSRLAREFRSGDSEAFENLVNLFQERIFRVAYRMTGSVEDSLDIVQECFLRVYKNIHQWNERSSIYSWIYRIAANLAVDHLRAKVKDRKSREGYVEKIELEGKPDFLDEEEKAVRLNKLKQVVETLPPAQRITVVLRHYEGLPLKEIAEIRGCALGTIKSTLFQAFRVIQRALTEVDEERT